MADSYTGDGGAYAKYGGMTGGSWLNGLANIMLPAYEAAFPKARAANLANGINQAYNIQAFNKQSRKDKAEKEANNAAIFGQSTGMNLRGDFDPALANSQAPLIRENNANPSIQGLVNGDPLTINAKGHYDPAFIDHYLTQQNAATNAQNAPPMIAGGVGQGQGLGLGSIGGPAGMPPGAPSQPPAGPVSALDSGNGTPQGAQPVLSAGAAMQAPPPAIPTNVSPYMLPTDVPAGLAGLAKAGLDDKQAAGTLANQQATLGETIRHNTGTMGETAKHNRADESIGRTNAQAHMISANKPVAGRAPSPVDFMSPEQKAEYAARTASGKTAAPIVPNVLQQGYLNDLKEKATENTGWFRHPADPQAAAQYNTYAPHYGLPPLPGTPKRSPFGNASRSNLTQASNTVTGAKGTYKY